MKSPTLLSLLLLVSLAACGGDLSISKLPEPASENTTAVEIPRLAAKKVVENALEQTRTTRYYTQEYFTIPYPNGDVPPETGACTDVVIRSFRTAGVDLQREVHEDMAANFSAYPGKWGLKRTDPNIDHRRVPNLQTYFIRQGKSLPVSADASDYEPGDVVTWDLNGKGMTHIGIVSNLRSEHTKRFLIVHNIGEGTRAEDRLFDWKITGHFRYF